MKRDFLSIADLTPEEMREFFRLAADIKAKTKRGEAYSPLFGKTLAMIFQKPSNRTRVSFEVGMYQLGGRAICLSPEDIQLGKREPVADVARTLSRYCDGIMARLFGHQDIVELARWAEAPVINGLTDLLHPCQVMGDLFTILEHRGNLDDLKVAFVGDGNNVANSWLNASSRMAMELRLAIPKGYEPNPEIFDNARQSGLSQIHGGYDPEEAVREADVVYTDVWVSMGQEAEREKRMVAFKGFQVNEELIRLAKENVLVMHCLPAHRGEEITEAVIEGKHSVVFDQVENRLHIQKAILVELMG